jgi:hypothetical protein
MQENVITCRIVCSKNIISLKLWVVKTYFYKEFKETNAQKFTGFGLH